MLIGIYASALGALFLDSAWAKLRNPRLFTDILQEYRLPARIPAGWLARALPVFDVALGALLWSWPWLSPAPGLGIATAFLSVTAALAGSRWIRGEREFACGCGSNLSDKSPAWWVIVRNLVLSGGILMALRADHPAWLSPAWAFYLCGVGLVTSGKLFHATIRAWRRGRGWPVPG